MPSYGRNPAKGLEPRACEVCGEQFQPYRASQTTCSLAHYKQSPRYRERQNAARRTPEYRGRKNEWRRTDPRQKERARRDNRRQQLSRYGLTIDDYDRMLVAQGGVCAICGSPPNPDGVRAASRLHADHDHVTGRNRDLICLSCNVGIGHFRDDPDLMQAAADYIKRHRARVAEGINHGT
jgi:hypothetical protein